MAIRAVSDIAKIDIIKTGPVPTVTKNSNGSIGRFSRNLPHICRYNKRNSAIDAAKCAKI